MSRWVPKNADKCAGFGGFYIGYKDIYDKKGDKNVFSELVDRITDGVREKYPGMESVRVWDGDELVFLRNNLVNFVIGGDSKGVGVFVVVSERIVNAGVAMKNMAYYIDRLGDVLDEMYPGKVIKAG